MNLWSRSMQVTLVVLIVANFVLFGYIMWKI